MQGGPRLGGLRQRGCEDHDSRGRCADSGGRFSPTRGPWRRCRRPTAERRPTVLPHGKRLLLGRLVGRSFPTLRDADSDPPRQAVLCRGRGVDGSGFSGIGARWGACRRNEGRQVRLARSSDCLLPDGALLSGILPAPILGSRFTPCSTCSSPPPTGAPPGATSSLPGRRARDSSPSARSASPVASAASWASLPSSPPGPQRLAAYTQRLDRHDDGARSYSASRKQDPFGVARYLLSPA